MQNGESISDLTTLVEAAADRFGARCFAESEDGSEKITFDGLAAQMRKIAAGLSERFSLGPGDHAALLLPNCVSFLPAYFGILRTGAAAVPVNTRLKPAELEYILDDSRPQALFVHPRTWPAADRALQAHPDLRQRLIAVDFPPGEAIPEGAVRLESFLTPHEPSLPSPHPSSESTAALLYTSGTTGQPKGAMLAHANILFNVQATIAGHGLKGSDVHLLVVPLFHVTGLNTILPTALEQGARLVISSQVDPERLVETIHRAGCTTFFGVPTTFYLLTNLKSTTPERVKSLRLLCYSGAPMAPLTILKLREMFPGVELHNFFGLTETTSVSTVLPDEQALSRSESVGLPPPGVELAIMDEEDRILPAGQVGELVIRGPGVFKGYYRRPEATAEALRGGWFHTGDAAVLDEEGFLFLRGRKKEMIIVAGENVYPIEVENALCSHAAVQEAAVFGRSDGILGEVVHAAVVLRPGETVSERDLKRHLNERLASYKMPRTIRFLEKLPRNPSGKVVKREL